MHLNLLPRVFVRRRGMHRVLRAYAGLAVLLCLLGLATCGPRYRTLVSLASSTALLAEQSAELRHLSNETERLRQRHSTSLRRIAVQERGRTDKQTLTLLGLLGTCVQKAKGGIRLLHMNIALHDARATTAPMTPTPPVPNISGTPGGSSAATSTPASTLTFDGTAETAASIARLISGLRRAGVLTEIELRGSSEEASTLGKGRHFHVEARF